MSPIAQTRVRTTKKHNTWPCISWLGGLERDLIAKDLCERVVGFDCSGAALELARQHAAAAGCGDRVEYRLADLERLPNFTDMGIVPASAEMVFFHQSLHHLENVDGAVAGALVALTPGGLIYLDEYVGPSRFEWTREALAVASAVFASLPRSLRRRSELAAPIDRADPTEAQNSSAILPAVRARVANLVERPYGGNLLSVIWPWLATAQLDSATRNDLAIELLAREDELLATGASSYYAVLTGTTVLVG